MAILHRKEEKIQVVLGRLPKKYTHEQFVEMFIKLYSKDWGKIKSAYIKQSQDKEPGTVITMPKPDLYLKQVLDAYLTAAPIKPEATAQRVAHEKESQVINAEVAVKKPIKTTKKLAPKQIEATEADTAPVKEAKTATKKKVVNEGASAETVKEVKKKAPAKKKVASDESPVKVKKAKAVDK